LEKKRLADECGKGSGASMRGSNNNLAGDDMFMRSVSELLVLGR
jgi:hypothetical protein